MIPPIASSLSVKTRMVFFCRVTIATSAIERIQVISLSENLVSSTILKVLVWFVLL